MGGQFQSFRRLLLERPDPWVKPEEGPSARAGRADRAIDRSARLFALIALALFAANAAIWVDVVARVWGR